MKTGENIGDLLKLVAIGSPLVLLTPKLVQPQDTFVGASYGFQESTSKDKITNQVLVDKLHEGELSVDKYGPRLDISASVNKNSVQPETEFSLGAIASPTDNSRIGARVSGLKGGGSVTGLFNINSEIFNLGGDYSYQSVGDRFANGGTMEERSHDAALDAEFIKNLSGNKEFFFGAGAAYSHNDNWSDDPIFGFNYSTIIGKKFNEYLGFNNLDRLATFRRLAARFSQSNSTNSSSQSYGLSSTQAVGAKKTNRIYESVGLNTYHSKSNTRPFDSRTINASVKAVLRKKNLDAKIERLKEKLKDGNGTAAEKAELKKEIQKFKAAHPAKTHLGVRGNWRHTSDNRNEANITGEFGVTKKYSNNIELGIDIGLTKSMYTGGFSGQEEAITLGIGHKGKRANISYGHMTREAEFMDFENHRVNVYLQKIF